MNTFLSFLFAPTTFFAPTTAATTFTTPPKTVTIRNDKLRFILEYGDKASITGITVNGHDVTTAPDGAYTSIGIDGTTWSSLHLLSAPILRTSGDTTTLDKVTYGDKHLPIREKWIFISTPHYIQWRIERTLPKALTIEASATPQINFDKINTWDGAYQGYGGLAWFYLFNEKLCTYGVHTQSSSFWSSTTNTGLDVQINPDNDQINPDNDNVNPGNDHVNPGNDHVNPGNDHVNSINDQVAMKYTRAADDRLEYAVTVSNHEILPRYDSGTNRRRFIRGKTDVWAPIDQPQGKTVQTIRFSYFDVNARYGRGKFVGIDGSRVSGVLNTIARIGVIDSLHFGGNSWHTPYGPICLHEQYIAQMGLAINDPNYLKGYQSCLDFYRDHAIRPDGRVIARWAYNDEDMMAGQNTKEGFYEAQWGFLLDANPDYVTNVSELYDLTGDKTWVARHQRACEKALDWLLARDSNGNGLVEMMTNSEKEKRGSDWIDIIWASYENAFVNAKLYHALLKWAAIERQLGNIGQASRYTIHAEQLRSAFNRPITQGGFWDETSHCYVHWLDKDGSAHGRNMVTPVNFMAIGYGICTDTARRNAILDSIEAQMQREQLFFWPLCMTSYAAGEGNDWQFPFPNYENGDLFLSWGSVAAAAYAPYKPEIAIKYIRNVLDRYSKDGLAFQRYGRKKQDGLGDDILSGNCLSVVGLYQAIYGINPLYNRFYLNPHLTPELSGTSLRYNFRGKMLIIDLDISHYSITDGNFKLSASEDFGMAHHGDNLLYFHSAEDQPAMKVSCGAPLDITIRHWSRDRREWDQLSAASASYALGGLAPNTTYAIFIDGKKIKDAKSDSKGGLTFNAPVAGDHQKTSRIMIAMP